MPGGTPCSKNSGDKRLTTVMLTGAAAIMAALLLPLLPSPARASELLCCQRIAGR